MRPSGKVFLDTSIAIAHLEGEASVAEEIDNSEQVGLPAPALGELYYGAKKSTRAVSNLQKIDNLLTMLPVADVDATTAAHYGAIKDELRAKGKPIPENDLWIAALCRQHDAGVATRDHHFDHVDGLTVLRW